MRSCLLILFAPAYVDGKRDSNISDVCSSMKHFRIESKMKLKRYILLLPAIAAAAAIYYQPKCKIHQNKIKQKKKNSELTQKKREGLGVGQSSHRLECAKSSML